MSCAGLGLYIFLFFLRAVWVYIKYNIIQDKRIFHSQINFTKGSE